MVRTDIYFDPETETICIRDIDETGAVITTLPQIRLTLEDLQYAGTETIEMICRRIHYTSSKDGSKKRCYGLLTKPESDTTDDGHSSDTEDLWFGGGGGGSTCFKYHSQTAEYLVCRTWDPTGSGTEGSVDINIAKPFKLRQSAPNVTIDAQAIAYSNWDWSDAQKRTATCAGVSAKEAITPRYVAGDLIWADTPDHTGVVVSSAELKYMDTNRDGRAWSRLNNQA
jgi:hypothetical protein